MINYYNFTHAAGQNRTHTHTHLNSQMKCITYTHILTNINVVPHTHTHSIFTVACPLTMLTKQINYYNSQVSEVTIQSMQSEISLFYNHPAFVA